MPFSPIDTFAVVATLVERSGAYRQVIRPGDDAGRGFVDEFELAALRSESWAEIARAWGGGIHFALKTDTDDWNAFADASKPQYPEKSEEDRKKFAEEFKRPYLSFDQLCAISTLPLQTLWLEVIDGRDDAPVVAEIEDPRPLWWRPALWLMILSDMACSGVGFWPRQRNDVISSATFVQQDVLNRARQLAEHATATSHGMLTTIASDLIDNSLCAVLPKTRTSALGCTLRSMTHNLALLPSPGLVEARWRIPSAPPPRAAAVGAVSDATSKSLNILLIPFPYRFGSACFVPAGNRGDEDGNKWAFFHMQQRWLHRLGEPLDDDVDSANDLLKFVRLLLKRAEADLSEIHTIVFPEFSLNRQCFDILSKELFKNRHLEFIVAGLSEEPNHNQASHMPRAGNFVAVRGRPFNGQSTDWEGDHSREKHHRWKIDGRQVERYGLSNSLDSKTSWWEGIPLGRRVIDFFVPRAGTAMTVLICEDLARADPVQTVVRSIGPNLVLALLMDGPQRKFRWPGHYAGVLADDPGCSVLTFTSLALVARGMTSDTDQSRSIAFFRNSLGAERELFLPQGSHALALRLCAQPKTEHSLDGRDDGNSAFIWELREVTPVRTDIDASTRWIVEGST